MLISHDLPPLKVSANRGLCADSGLFTRAAGQGAISNAIACGLISHPAIGPVARVFRHSPSRSPPVSAMLQPSTCPR
jgi:hypothetical protein